MTKHPDVHPPWRTWSEEQILHVAVAYSNPMRWASRRVLMNEFREHMRASANVVLHVGELAYGDFHMTRRDWALEAIHQLQHYDLVQLFSSYSDLSSEHRPFRMMPSFAFNYVKGTTSAEYRKTLRAAAGAPYVYYGGQAVKAGGKPAAWPVGATGGAWAFRRSAFDAVGGLLDTCILGSADWHMAFGLVGAVDAAAELRHCSRPYVDAVLRWQARAATLKQNIGYVDNHAIHYFHGSKLARAYGSRWRILLDNQYDPRTDVSRDWQGVLKLAGNKPRLRDQIRAYFRDRNEDSPELSAQERHIV